MELSELLTKLTYEILQGTVKTTVGKVTNDTRELEEEDVFVCVKGYRTDGHRYVGEAVLRGASVLVVQDESCCQKWKEEERNKFAAVTVILVKDTRYALAVMAAACYGYPARKLRVVGITGTKGKTTTAYMIQRLLRGAGYRTGLIGTIQIDTGKRILVNTNTTPESCQIQAYFREMVEAGCDSVVMEVSSQGLKLGRTVGIPFEVGVFTNLCRDHIGSGEHAGFAEYLQCKHLLFLQSQIGVGNIDAPWYEEIFWRTDCRRITYGVLEEGGAPAADYYASDVRKWVKGGCPGSCYELHDAERPFSKEVSIELPMPGKFNVYNSLAAIAVAKHFQVEDAVIRRELKRIRIPGRMEALDVFEDGAVFVDYAHNAMSLKSILETVREYSDGRVVVVFGCGGNRAKQRRFEMGKAAGAWADLSIITSDNPREEEPEQIVQDILKGMKETKGNYLVIEDRKEAIRYVIENRCLGDIIVIAGKGHETYQEIRGIRYEFDDRKVVYDIMEEIRHEE